jgi:hypothetical protein
MKAIQSSGLAVIATLALCAAAAPADAQETWSWNRALAAGQTIEIKGINGSIIAGPGSGSDVRVTARKSARRSNVSTVTIEVVEHAGGVTICAVYPSPNANQPNECVPGSGGRNSVQNNDVQVEFQIAVPAGVNFTGRSVNGSVEARDLTGNVEARTVNGGIDVLTRGRAVGNTVNGAVNVTVGRADWTGTLSFQTVNGSLTVTLPASVNTEVTASTVNGGINTDFPMQVVGRFGPRSVNGTIGSGGRKLNLSTVNGAIHIRRQP